MTAVAALQARTIEVRGVVQGVGFRPFVWRLAERFGIHGWVRNGGGVVEISAEGSPADLDGFCAAISAEAPPLARVEDVRWTEAVPSGVLGFEVDESLDVEGGDRLVPPDSATCPDCLRELFDPADRRYRYPFINCTNCGPRFTIIETLPYDRERTTMRAFPMCEDCEREYDDPLGPPVPRRADRVPGVRPAACAWSTRRADRRRADPIAEAAGCSRPARSSR